jgi:hypothetical protein
MFQKRLAPPWSLIDREVALADRLPNRAAALQVQDIEDRAVGGLADPGNRRRAIGLWTGPKSPTPACASG